MNSLLLRFFNLDVGRKCRPLTAPDPRIVGNDKERNIQLAVPIANTEEKEFSAEGAVMTATLTAAEGTTPVQTAKLPPVNLRLPPGDVQVFKFWPPTVTLPADVPDGVYTLTVALTSSTGDVLASDSMGVRVNVTDLYAVADDPVAAPPGPVTPPDTNTAAAAELDANNAKTNELDGLIAELNTTVTAANQEIVVATNKKTGLQKRNEVLRTILAVLVLLAVPSFGCSFDRGGGTSLNGPRPNPYLKPRYLVQQSEASAGGWESSQVAIATVTEFPFILEGSIRWEAEPGDYRIIISDDGTNWWENSWTKALRTGSVGVRIPTNRFFKLISP